MRPCQCSREEEEVKEMERERETERERGRGGGGENQNLFNVQILSQPTWQSIRVSILRLVVRLVGNSCTGRFWRVGL